jgi:hypothetical protein
MAPEPQGLGVSQTAPGGQCLPDTPGADPPPRFVTAPGAVAVC